MIIITDKDKVINLFNELGIGFKDNVVKDVLLLEVKGMSEGCAKVKGYPNFKTDFLFDEQGKFIEVNIYE